MIDPTSPLSLPRISQEQADDAAAEVARFWPEIGRRWRWTRQPALVPVYQLIGETTVALLRFFPEIQWSNQALWYQRVVNDTPAIYALFPEVFAEEARSFLAGADPREIEGKQVLSFIYLAQTSDADAKNSGAEVAKTLLASTATDAPYYRSQLAHELLNGFCATEWDGQTLRSGARRVSWGAGARLQAGGGLSDLLIDTLLISFLPQGMGYPLVTLMNGMLGPYWQIVEAFARRLRQAPVREALFGQNGEGISLFERLLEITLDLPDAARELDHLLARHDWEALRAIATAG